LPVITDATEKRASGQRGAILGRIQRRLAESADLQRVRVLTALAGVLGFNAAGNCGAKAIAGIGERNIIIASPSVPLHRGALFCFLADSCNV
jgi:hypothetical protein